MMGKLLAVAAKELLLLKRDRSGLAVLFLMPVVLVLVVSLVQENVLKTMGESGVKLFLVNEDSGKLGARVASRLQGNGAMEVVSGKNRATALAAVAGGDAQFAIVIDKGATQSLRVRAERMARSGDSPGAVTGEEDVDDEETVIAPFFRVYFDPSVRGLLRTAVMSSLKLAVYEMEMTEKLKIFSGVMSERYGGPPAVFRSSAENLVSGGATAPETPEYDGIKGSGDPAPESPEDDEKMGSGDAVPSSDEGDLALNNGSVSLPKHDESPADSEGRESGGAGNPSTSDGDDASEEHFPGDWMTTPLMRIEDAPAFLGAETTLPTSVQQNVPAWALFGMFFVVVPMGASLVKEREDGTHLRVSAMPVSAFTLLTGKLAAYFLICLIQFALVLVIGKYLLPSLGTPALTLGGSIPALFCVLGASILAATGYGIFLGTVMKTYEQVSMFGPTSIVIAAALGGIMVPVYAMPAAMQKLSVISPLGWGLSGIHDVIIRGGELSMVVPELVLLLTFAFVSISVGSFFMFFRGR